MTTSVLELTDGNFADLVEGSDKLFLVDFWAKWCAPCRALRPTVEAIAQKRCKQITVGQIDTDANPEITARFGVCAMPTLLLFKNGQPVDDLVGNLPRDEIDSLIDRYL